VTACLPDNAIFGRLGGEEFALLLSDADTCKAEALAEEIRRAFAEVSAGPGGLATGATTSAGIATSPRGEVELAELFAAADAALYVAKARGRNRVQAHGLQGQAAGSAAPRPPREIVISAPGPKRAGERSFRHAG
jgi:diguanylate cyclase (GGDEF)-like protein